MTEARLGSVWTFYSYKGGVGRSFALANVATLLARWGHRTLCVDWDLEAPGLHLYFEPILRSSMRGGVVELVQAYVAGQTVDWRDYRAQVALEDARGSLDLMPAGRIDDAYVERMQDLEWGDLYRDAGVGALVERLRTEWKRAYDVVLVDSRTGVTDIGGICTVQLPDFLAILFTANNQSVVGAIDVAVRASAALDTLPLDRARLPALPVVTRFESTTEVDLARLWLRRIEAKIAPVVSPWLDRSLAPEDLLNHVKVPYVPRWSFGETLPVLDEGTADPLSIGYAFETLAALVALDLEHSALLATNRSSYVDAAMRAADAVPDAARNAYDYDVFLSFDRHDRDFADALIAELTRRGLRVWAAPEDVAQRGEFADSRSAALNRSRNMVALLGEKPSPWIEYESRQFLIGNISHSDDDRLFVPVVRERGVVERSRIWSQFRAVDAVERSPDEVVEELWPVLAGGTWAT